MKKFVIYLFVCTLMASCGKHKPTITIVPDYAKNHLEREHIYGKVKTITDKMYYVFNKSVDSLTEDRLCAVTVYHYGSDGWLNEVLKLSANGDTMSQRKIYYDDHAKMIRDELYDSTGVRIEYSLYENDKNGFRVKEEKYSRDSLVRTLLYQNDAFGNLVSMTMQTELFKMTRKYSNNEVGLAVRVDEFDPDGKLFKYVTMEYDNYGDIVNRNVYRDDGQLCEYTHTQYADNGCLLKTVYEDKLARMSEVREYSNHDEQKNWTKNVRKVDSKPLFVIDRKIIYY